MPSAQAKPEATEPSDLKVASGPAPEATPAPPPPAPPVRTQVARAAAPDSQAAEPMGAMDGDYQIWLVSMTDEAEAASFLQMARGKYPSVFGQARGKVARVEFPRGKVFYRVRLGPYGARAAASVALERVKAAGSPGARIVTN